MTGKGVCELATPFPTMYEGNKHIRTHKTGSFGKPERSFDVGPTSNYCAHEYSTPSGAHPRPLFRKNLIGRIPGFGRKQANLHFLMLKQAATGRSELCSAAGGWHVPSSPRIYHTLALCFQITNYCRAKQ